MGLGQNCRECPTTALYRHPADQATAMPSKHQFHSKLDLPRRTGFTGWEARVGDPAKFRRADNVPRLPEVRVVEKVEELSPELRAHALADLRIFGNRKIHVVEARPDDHVAAIELPSGTGRQGGTRSGRSRRYRSARPAPRRSPGCAP